MEVKYSHKIVNAEITIPMYIAVLQLIGLYVCRYVMRRWKSVLYSININLFSDNNFK